MLTKIQKWGNSQGLRLAKSLIEDAHLRVGDQVDVAVREGVILVAPARRLRGRHSLEDLVARIPRHYRPGEVVWGRPAGKEGCRGPSNGLVLTPQGAGQRNHSGRGPGALPH